MAAHIIYPALEDAPTHNYTATRSKGDRECLFSISVYVPADIKRPSAGVVTDKNLHPGEFAFLDVQVGEKGCGGARHRELKGAKNAAVTSDLEDSNEEKATGAEKTEKCVEAEVSATDGEEATERVHVKWLQENPYFPCKPPALCNPVATA
ncbi:unnamed protein product [Trypanosoma congolense IL3000]|uniref:WGS project CAEQ00000000 data, annotated contig 2192 n=1 Tax=Trypanosoma congolense (strain IL3000) TaxID=1068625 RepID=F9WC73_TRYCI|nr:unnamed protein product [Trypanosoma congolense IL3000]